MLDRRLRIEPLEDRRMLATFTVTNLLDGPVNAAGALPGSLRQAIYDANHAAGADEVFFENVAGTILLNSGELQITDDLTITGPGRELLTIDAQQRSRVARIFHSVDPYFDVTISDLTLTNGKSSGYGAEYGGGALRSENRGSVSIIACTVSNSQAVGTSAGGGGIFVEDGTLNVSGCIVSGNGTFGIDANGGGINAPIVVISDSEIDNNSTYGGSADGGGVYVTSSATISDSILRGNHTDDSGSNGGGLDAHSSQAHLSRCQISENSSYNDGGGISANFAEIISSTIVSNHAINGGGISCVFATLDDCQVTENSARWGGGLFVSYEPDIRRSEISRNAAVYYGGGLYIDSTFEGTIVESKINGNSARNGGGIYCNFGILEVSSCAVTSNTASSDGGGIWAINGYLNVTSSLLSLNTANRHGGGIYGTAHFFMSDCTLSQNTAGGFGGGLVCGDYSEIYRTTIVENTAPVGQGSGMSYTITGTTSPGPTLGGSIICGNENSDLDIRLGSQRIVSLGYNLIGTGTSASLFTGPGDQTGVLDPMLGPLQDNGGPTMTHALLLGSPAFNAGDPDTVAGVGGVPEFDQRGAGFSRVYGGRIDVGAYESQAISADFNSDGSVNGFDFLTWQRGFGLAAPLHTDGDADLDGDVDAADLAAWKSEYGAVEPALLSRESRVESPEPEAGSLVWIASLPLSTDQEQSGTASQAMVVPSPVEILADNVFAELGTVPRHQVRDFGDIATRRPVQKVALDLEW